MRPLLSLLFVLTFVLPAPSSAEAPAPSPYRIGVILPLSGDAASLGEGIKNSIDLAVSSLSQEKASKIQVVFEDDQMVPTKTVSAFQSMMAKSPLDAVLVVGSGMGHVIAPLAEQRKVVMIALGASDKTLLNGRAHSFIHWVSPEAESALLVDEIQKDGYKKIAFVGHEQQGVRAFYDVFVADLARRGLKDIVVLSEFYPQGTTDFRSFLTKAKSKGADSVFAGLFPGGLAPFAKELKQSPLKAPLFGAEFFEDDHEVKAADGALNGAWYVYAGDPSPQFLEVYKAAYDENPGLASANAYDSIQLLVNAVQERGKDNDKVAEYLRTLKDFHGAAGAYSASGDNRFTLPATTRKVTATGFASLH